MVHLQPIKNLIKNLDKNSGMPKWIDSTLSFLSDKVSKIKSYIIYMQCRTVQNDVVGEQKRLI